MVQLRALTRYFRFWVFFTAVSSSSLSGFAAETAPANACAATADLVHVTNFRDLGGVAGHAGQCVVRGAVFRGAALNRLDALDAEALLARSGLTGYYDLRAQCEVDRHGGPAALLARGVPWQRLPIDSSDDPFFAAPRGDAAAWASFYRRTLRRHAAVFAELLEALATAPLPVSIGCSMGKDRTGIAVALLYVLLGVDNDAIVADYAASTDCLLAHADSFAASWERWGMTKQTFIETFLLARPAAMRAFLGDFGELAPARQVADLLGLPATTVAALQARLLQAQTCSH